MIDEVAPWTLTFVAKNRNRNEIEIENKFSIDNKGKSTQTGINFRLFRANFDTRCLNKCLINTQWRALSGHSWVKRGGGGVAS